MKKEIYSINAPKPIGPYSQCIKFENMIFISGQIAINPKTNDIITNNISEETKMVMQNLKNILLLEVIKHYLLNLDISMLTYPIQNLI